MWTELWSKLSVITYCFPLIVSGYIHIGYNQDLFVNNTNSDIPFNAHVYENGKATYPPRPFFYQTHLHTSGEVSLWLFSSKYYKLFLVLQLSIAHLFDFLNCHLFHFWWPCCSKLTWVQDVVNWSTASLSLNILVVDSL